MTFTTPSKHDPDGIDIDNNFEEQEKWEQTYYLDGNVFIKMTNSMWKVIDGNDGLVKTISPRPERNPMSDTVRKIEEQIIDLIDKSVLHPFEYSIRQASRDILSIVREAVDEVFQHNYLEDVSDCHSEIIKVLS